MAKKRVKKKTKKKAAAKLRSTVQSATVPAQTSQEKSSPVITPYPTAGPKIIDFEEQLDRQLGGGDEKRKPGRPPKAEEPSPPECSMATIARCCEIPFNLWAKSQGIPALKLSPGESNMMAEPVKLLLDHYMPLSDISMAWIGLVAVSYTVMESRLDLIAQIKKRKMVPGKQAAAPQETPPSKQSPAHFPSMDEIGKPEV